MALPRRSGQRRDVSGAIWPGFVDAMTALLLVLTFVLSIFMIVQFVLRDTLSARETELEGLSLEVASLANALGLSRARVDALEGQVGSLSDDLGQAQALAAAQLAQITGLTRDLQARDAALGAAQSRITDFEAQVAALIAARDTALAEGAALGAQRDALEAAQAQLMSEQDALQLALAALRDELDAETEAARLAAARADAIEAALAETRADLAARDISLAALVAQLTQTEADLSTRETALTAAQADLDAARADLTQMQTDMAAIRTELTAAEQEALAEQAAAQILRDRLAEAQSALTEEEQARLADIAAAEALRQRLENADAELTAMTLALEAQRARAEETLTLLAAARAAQAETEAALQAELSERERVAALRALAEQELATRDAQSLDDQRRLEVLNQQVAALRGQVGGLQELLGEVRLREEAAQTQIESLGADLNIALAELAVEQKARADLEAAERARLESFRSEFFGQLRQVLEGREGVQIVGDRFVFSSEVLFELGSADLAPEGRVQIGNVVALLNEVANRIPPNIDWILQVEGHTDNLAIAPGGRFADNWALSQARALSVVRYLTEERGFPASRLSAAGFGEYRPVDPSNTAEARSRNRRIELKLTER